MRNYGSTLILSMVFLFACTEAEIDSPTKENSDSIQTKLNEVVDLEAQAKDFMGNVALMHNGKLIYSRAIGYDDIESKKLSTVDSKYRIGSVSKTFTAVLIFKAIEDGKLTLDQTIENLFPKLKNSAQIRIADLLQHRSGIPNFTKDKQFFSYHTELKSKQEMLNMILSYGSDFVPNSKGEYSNSNYFLLAYILEEIYGTPYEVLLKEKITTQLGLKYTYQGSKVSLSNNESYSYQFASGWEPLPETHMSITLGAGSIVSTASEVAAFLDALFNGRIISTGHVEKMQSMNSNFGMGLVGYDLASRFGVGHRGTLDGYKSTAIYFPDDKVTLVVTSNGSNGNSNELFEDILKAYFDDPLVAISIKELEKFAGVYTSMENKSDKAVFIRNEKMLVHVIQDEFKDPLTYKGQRKFLFEQMYGPAILFTFSKDGSELLFEQGEYKGRYVKNNIN